MKNRAPFFVAILACLLWSACNPFRRNIFYYDLNGPSASEANAPKVSDGSRPLNVVLGVRRLDVLESYERPTIAYREWGSLADSMSSQVKFHPERRWAVAPANALTGMVLETLRASGRFKQVVPWPSPTVDADYVLEGKARRLEPVLVKGGRRKGGYVRIDIVLWLKDREGKKVASAVVQWDGLGRGPAFPANSDVKTIDAMVAEMSRRIRQQTAAAIEGIARVLASRAEEREESLTRK